MIIFIQATILILSIILIIIGAKCVYLGRRLLDKRLNIYGSSIIVAASILFGLYFLEPMSLLFQCLGFLFIAASICVRYFYDKYDIKAVFFKNNINFRNIFCVVPKK